MAPFTKMLQAKHKDLSLMSLLAPDIHFISKSLHGSPSTCLSKPLAASNFTAAVLAQDLIMSLLDFSNSNLKHLLFDPAPNHQYLIANGIFKIQVQLWNLLLKSLPCLAISLRVKSKLCPHHLHLHGLAPFCLCITTCLLTGIQPYLPYFLPNRSTWPCLRDLAFVPSAQNNLLLGPCMVFFSSLRSHSKHSLNKKIFLNPLFYMPCFIYPHSPLEVHSLVIFLKDLSFSENI